MIETGDKCTFVAFGRLWSDPNDELDFDVLPRAVFKRMSMFRNRLVAMGIKAEPIFPKYCAQNEDECV